MHRTACAARSSGALVAQSPCTVKNHFCGAFMALFCADLASAAIENQKETRNLTWPNARPHPEIKSRLAIRAARHIANSTRRFWEFSCSSELHGACGACLRECALHVRNTPWRRNNRPLPITAQCAIVVHFTSMLLTARGKHKQPRHPQSRLGKFPIGK